MPIGSDLNVILPDEADSPEVAAARTVECFEALVDAVEGQVPLSAVDANDNLDMDGHHLDSVGFLGLENQTTDEGTAGRLYRKNGDLWWVTATGAMQITDGTSVNASGVGGIGGDFGGANPAHVDYVDVSERYEFYDDVGDLSGVMGDRVILKNGVGLCTHTTNAASNVTWTWPAAPATSGILQATTAGSISVSPVLGYKVTFNALPAHIDQEKTVPLIPYIVTAGTGQQGSAGFNSTAGNITAYFPIPGATVGSRITGVKARIARGATAGTASVQLYYFAESAGAWALTAIGSANTSAATSAYVTLQQLGINETVVTNRQYFIRVDLPTTGANGDYLGALTVIQDRT